ncbi:CBS domain-containing protein [Hyphomicrobium sp.]|uniref:CBS domain-containing protein n=1 Tax=Hyphomicrobium sp. TaxID=82 RepID=UPI002E33A843|nr:CBS domain-containing protein [Hyphomicrobium sp.]HEX2841269.1 CBS domain-containing protein [Hyphomicrobium sp.]
MRVVEFLEKRGRRVFTVKTSESIGYLARQLQRHRIGVMVVSDNGHAIDGIISERDIAYSLAERRGELHLLPVSALMVRRVITCSPQDTMSYVMELMKVHHIRHIPVQDAGRLAGVISMRDALEFRLDEIERKANLAQLTQMVD